MSQLPDKVFLHNDEKYNTGDFYLAYSEADLEIKAIDEEVNMDDYTEYIRKDLVDYYINERLHDIGEKWAKQIIQGKTTSTKFNL